MITELQLTNYLVFKGSIHIEFDVCKKATIIASPNAAGKTSLISSIFWCLYGELPKEVNQSVCSLLNVEIAYSLEEDNSTQVSVSITVQHNGEVFELSRIADCVKTSGTILIRHEHIYINQCEDNVLFDTVVNHLFPRKFAPIFYWNEDLFYSMRRGLKMEEFCPQEDKDSIARLANRLFNQIYFRSGQYELLFDDELLAKEVTTGFCDVCPSMADTLMMKLSLLLACCLTVQEKQPNVSFPVLIDSIFLCAGADKARKPIDLLFNKSQFQVIMAEHYQVIDDLFFSGCYYQQSINVYEIKPNQNCTTSILVRKNAQQGASI